MNVTVNVHAGTMIDRSMLSNRHRVSNGFLVGRKLVRDKDLKIETDVLPNVTCKRATHNVFGVEQSKLAAALSDADHNLFSVGGLLTRPMASARLAADESLIHFNFA